MDQSEKFWNKIAQKYAKQAIEDEASYTKKLEITRTHLQPNMKVLEIGCGTGSTAISHAPYVKHIHAVDISSKMIEIAQNKASECNIDNITFEHTTIDALHLTDNSLDIVLGLSILHLLEDKEAVIRKVYKALKPGGMFITSTTCLADNMAFIKYIVPIGRLFGFMPLLKVFTTKELENTLSAAHFNIDYQWQPSKGKAVFIVAKKTL